MSGSGSLTQIGPNGLILSGANTFNGSTIIAGGTLLLTNGNALQNSTVLPSGGQLSFDTTSSHSFTLGGLAGSGGVDLGQSHFSNFVDLFVGNNNTDSMFSGVFAGTGEIIKIGTGTLTLTGNNSGFLGILGGAVQLGSATTLANAGVDVGVDGGIKFSPGISSFTVDVLSGSNGFALADTTGAPVTVQISAPFGYSGGLFAANFRRRAQR